VKCLQIGGISFLENPTSFFLKNSSDTQWVSWGKNVLEKTDGGFYAV